jgi:hypothetical protein
MLFIARGGCRGRRHGLRLGDDRDLHPILPGIAVTNHNRRPIAFCLLRTAGLAFKGHIPFPVPPHFIASCTYSVRGILIGLGNMVAEMHFPEHVCVMFRDGLPTVNRSLRSHKNRVLREERCHGGGIVIVVCLVKLFRERISHLA